MEFLGPEAWKHRDALEEVKRRVGVTHHHFDCWIYKFLENKHFDIEETVAKLIRRADMERNEFATYEMNDVMKASMRSGVMTIIGEDKEGRVTFYAVTSRDFPTKEIREDRKRNFDMWVSYGCRIRKFNPKCAISLLVNQRGASIWSNTDMTFQTNVAIRISKYYPGVVEKAWVCCMSGALGAVARPILRAMPRTISERIVMYNEEDVAKGILLEFLDESVIPVSLGGKNTCDDKEHWDLFSATIEDWFSQAKAAIQAGQSMKEFELEVAQADEREELERKRHDRMMQRSFATGSIGSGGRNESFTPQPDGSLMPLTDDMRSPIGAVQDEEELFTCGTPSETRSLTFGAEMSQWPMEMSATAMLESQETFFRENYEELQRTSYESVSTQYLNALDAAVEVTSRRDEAQHLAMRCPRPARSLTHGVVTVLCVLIAAYFLAASLFAQLVCCSIIIVLFLGMFFQPYYIYPLGLALLLVGHQACLLGSRGFELAHASLRGTLLRPLQPLGKHGLAIQFVLFLVLVLIQITAFLATSSFDDPLNALSIAFAIGWLTCLVLIIIFHLGFPVGLSQEPPSRKSQNVGGLSLYLFIDVTEGEEADVPERLQRRLTSTTIVTAAPSLAASLFGLAFMISTDVVFLIGCTVTVFVAAFSINHFLRADFSDLNSNLARSSAWMSAVVWLYCVSAVGLIGWVSPWYQSVIVAACSTIAFVALTVICHVVRRGTAWHRYLFRAGYGLLAVIIVTGIVILFTMHWALGLFALIMLIHSMVSFARPSSTTVAGAVVVTIVSMIIFIYADVLAFYQATPYDKSSVVFANQSVPVDSNTIPVCTRRWADTLTVAEFAYCVHSSYASTTTLCQADIARLNPNLALVTRSTINSFVFIDEFRHTTTNSSIFSVGMLPQRLPLLNIVTYWIEAIALTPHALILPMNWTEQFVTATAFVNAFFPLQRAVVQDVESSLLNLTNASRSKNKFIVGHGLAGGVASIVGARNRIETVTFSAPGLLFSRDKFDVSYYNYLRYVASIVPSTGVLVTIDSHGPRQLVLPCNSGPVACQSVDFVVCSVASSCGSAGNASLSQCLQIQPIN